MMIKASGRSALILATGLFVCFAGPSPAPAAGAIARHFEIGERDAEKSTKARSRLKRIATRSENPATALKSAETRKAD